MIQSNDLSTNNLKLQFDCVFEFVLFPDVEDVSLVFDVPDISTTETIDVPDLEVPEFTGIYIDFRLYLR